MRWRNVIPYLAAGFGYLAITVAGLYALIADFTIATPGIAGENADFAQFHWNIWWFQHALLQLGRDPYFTNYILFPNTINLAYHTFTPLLNILALPIYATLDLTAALNSWIVVSLVFNGLAMFAFLRHHRVSGWRTLRVYFGDAGACLIRPFEHDAERLAAA
jgi:signal transduction histidine kinase